MMAGFGKPPPPGWYYLVVGVFTLWSAIGCYFCYLQFRLGAEWMADATDYDRALYAGLPGWYNYCYAVAVGAGTLGGVVLLARSAVARPLLALSLLAVVIQFGYLFAMTDIIAHKGFLKVVPFPAFIALVAIGALWLSGLAMRRRWAD